MFEWNLGTLDVHGTEYQFESSTFQSSQTTVVYNFMVMPDGKILPDMDALQRYLKLDMRFFGVAQVQIVFSGLVVPEKREQIARELIKGHMQLIDVIRSGVRS